MTENRSTIRVLLLGDARQVHIHRWNDYLIDNGFETLTVSLEPVDRVTGARQRIRVPGFIPDLIRYPLAVPRVESIVGEFEPDIVNAHFVPNYGVIAAMTGFEPWVLSTWGSDILTVPDKTIFHMERTRHVIRRATYITSDAEVMSRRIVDLGAHPDRVITFPFGVDRARFSPTPEDTPVRGLRVLSNRKMEEVYGIDVLVAAFARVRETVPDARLTLAGSGSKQGALRKQVVGLDIGDAVRFPGEIAHINVPALLRDHNLFVSIARSDTTSVSLLEAMACGLFPIVSDIPANREWIEHGTNGLVVPLADAAALAMAITDAWKNPALRADAAKRNADLVEARADWSSNMSIVKDLFERIASG
jgi:glycosyltransferase involved in cell wall biosynthesis